MKRTQIYAAVPALLLIAALTGCQPKDPPPPPGTPPGGTGTPAPTPKTDAKAAPKDSTDAIRDAVEKSLAENPGNVYPAGVRLLSVDMKDGVASLDFNKAFSDVANRGESGESEVQKSLRRTLADFPDAVKMRVTVEGHPFDSQATDWNTPFAVRGAPDTGVKPASNAKDTGAKSVSDAGSTGAKPVSEKTGEGAKSVSTANGGGTRIQTPGDVR